jgi:hypothetical protein
MCGPNIIRNAIPLFQRIETMVTLDPAATDSGHDNSLKHIPSELSAALCWFLSRLIRQSRRCSETADKFQLTTWRYVTEDRMLRNHRR